MPIKNTTNGSIPYLIGYTPYRLPSGTVECLTVADMFDYNIISTNFDYFIGESSGSIEFIFKNLTNETTIEVDTRRIQSNVLVDSTENVTFLKIEPLQSQSLKFRLNTSSLDVTSVITTITGALDITVKNIFNNTLATKSGSNVPSPLATPLPTPSVTPNTSPPAPQATPPATPSVTPTQPPVNTPSPTPSPIANQPICFGFENLNECGEGFYCDTEIPLGITNFAGQLLPYYSCKPALQV